MMREKYFYDLPVYRLSSDKYYNDAAKYIDKHFSSMNKFSRDYYNEHPKKKALLEDSLRKNYGGAWDFNEIIGYIKLYFFGTQIRGTYWAVDAKRIVRSRKKNFVYKNWNIATEVNIHFEKDSATIYSKIHEYISRCKSELKNRYIDISRFEEIGPYVDWKGIYDEFRLNE